MTIRIGLYGVYGDFPRLGEVRASELHAANLGPCQGVPRPHGNHRALLLGKRRKQVQDERINVRPKLGNYELHALCHQARDEMYVAAKAVKLGHGNGAAAAAGLCEGTSKPRAAVERV